MAQKTKCLTNGAQFHIHISSSSDNIEVKVALPTGMLDCVDEKEAELLSRLIHNQLELVLRPYFEKHNNENARVKLKLV